MLLGCQILGHSSCAFAKQCGARSVPTRFLFQREVQQGIAMSRIQVQHLTKGSRRKIVVTQGIVQHAQ